MISLSAMAMEMNAMNRGEDHSPFGVFYCELPAPKRTDKATIILRTKLATKKPGTIVPAHRVREEGLAI